MRFDGARKASQRHQCKHVIADQMCSTPKYVLSSRISAQPPPAPVAEIDCGDGLRAPVAVRTASAGHDIGGVAMPLRSMRAGMAQGR